jgi:hypothetical protein
MDLQYKLTFGKFKGHTLQDIADNNNWYLDMIAKVEWLVKKIRTEMNKDDIAYLQAAQNKHHSEQEKRFNNMVVSSYFPSKGWNNDDYSNYCGIHGGMD